MVLGDREEEEVVTGEAPRFVTEFGDQFLEENGNAYCEAQLLPKNDSAMTIQWTLNGKALQESELIWVIFAGTIFQ